MYNHEMQPKNAIPITHFNKLTKLESIKQQPYDNFVSNVTGFLYISILQILLLRFILYYQIDFA